MEIKMFSRVNHRTISWPFQFADCESFPITPFVSPFLLAQPLKPDEIPFEETWTSPFVIHPNPINKLQIPIHHKNHHWLVVLEHVLFSHSVGNGMSSSQLTNSLHHFFSGVGRCIPPTSCLFLSGFPTISLFFEPFTLGIHVVFPVSSP